MFETLLNFVAGVIFGTIFVLMILFFMMCILWCRPVPRVPIAKNLPPNKTSNEVEETTKWISIFTSNKYFHNWLQLKLASSIQSEIEKLQYSDDLKSSNESINNINFKVYKTECPYMTFNTVKTVNTIEGTAISSFPISFSSNIKVETEILINLNSNTSKKIKSIAIISSSQPTLQITIPYEKGIILIELLLGLDANISFEDDIITEEIKEDDGKIQEKESKLSTQEEVQVEAIKKLLSQFLNHASFKIDVDTVPIEEQTKDIITETDPKEIEGVGNPDLNNKNENPSSLQENGQITEKVENQPNIASNEAEDKKEIKNEVENENKNEVESEEKSEVESEDKNEVESEDKNEDDEDKNEDDDEDEDEDDEEYLIGKISPMRREFVVDQEIQEIVDQATSLINDKTTTTTTQTTTNPKPQ